MDLALADAAQALGHGFAPDHNAPGATGISPFAINSRDSARVSVVDGYLEPARSRANLTIVGNALVDRVLLDGRRAIGVRVRLGGVWVEIKADLIILSAGAVHSPAILMRSGIGPADHLRALGIQPVAALPVGDNLQDHPVIVAAMPLKSAVRVPDITFRHTNCCLRYASGRPGTAANDMIIMAFNLFFRDRATGRLGVSVYQSFSAGTLRLASADPDVNPVIDENMLSDPRDLGRMREGVALLNALTDQPAFRDRIDGAPVLVRTRAPLDPLPGDDAPLAEVGDAQHITSTCAMGRVVDAECRVLAFDNLRAIDASVMPQTVRANTNLTTIMIAERMAEQLAR
jgi:choline dehydrogenase